jgi:hypothetical protein
MMCSSRGEDVPLEVAVHRRNAINECEYWRYAFANERKDHRYFELIADTIHPEFDHWYFTVKKYRGSICFVQPAFILNQDLLSGTGLRLRSLAGWIRVAFPHFMIVRTLMIGSVVGEGHLDCKDELSQRVYARALAETVVGHAKSLGARIVVLKEFPSIYRPALASFLDQGFVCVPSLPMTRLPIDYDSFEEYMRRRLNSSTRTKLRRKFRAVARAPSIKMSILTDITPIIEDVYPLYLNVYHRSEYHFEKLTKEYFCSLGSRIPDKVRFFVWRLNGRVVAFTMCFLHEKIFYPEYIGLDYTVALTLHLYHHAYRDMLSWAIAHGFRELRSGGLNYDPKLHLRHLLYPLDLYVRHTSPILNVLLKWALPFLGPVRRDKTLQKFANYGELWRPTRARYPSMRSS